MEPSSEDEILPSPLASNLLKTCESSSSICAFELREGLREIAGVWDREFGRGIRFFLRLKRDFNPIMANVRVCLFPVTREEERENTRLVVLWNVEERETKIWKRYIWCVYTYQLVNFQLII